MCVCAVLSAEPALHFVILNITHFYYILQNISLNFKWFQCFTYFTEQMAFARC